MSRILILLLHWNIGRLKGSTDVGYCKQRSEITCSKIVFIKSTSWNLRLYLLLSHCGDIRCVCLFKFGDFLFINQAVSYCIKLITPLWIIRCVFNFVLNFFFASLWFRESPFLNFYGQWLCKCNSSLICRLSLRF